MIKTKSHTLESLFLEKKYVQVSQLTDSILEKEPGNLAIRYCAGLAEIMSGQIIKGLSHLMIILQIYKKVAAQTDSHTRRFVGNAAYHFALLYEANSENIMDRTSHCIDAANLIKDIGLELNDMGLIAYADSILSRVWRGRNSENGNPTQILRPEAPYKLQVEPTNNCNLKCTMCPRHHMTRRTGLIDESLWSDILDSWIFKRRSIAFDHLVHKTKITLHFRGHVKLFFMGEPMLHPELDILISKANDTGSQMIVQTNGVLMANDNLRQKLLHAHPSTIAISLDGIDTTSYESVREGSNWERIVSGLTSLNRERSELELSKQIRLQISTIVPEDTESNRKQALDLLGPIKELVDDILFVPLNRSYNPDFFNSEGNMETFHRKDAQPFSGNVPLCLEPMDKLNVLWDGTITPCCHDVNGQLVLGHAKNGIDNVWNGEQTKSLHTALINKEFDKFPLCKSCMG
jgi:uncharacterized Fe-S cluster-containing radical SAM superfamily protein